MTVVARVIPDNRHALQLVLERIEEELRTGMPPQSAYLPFEAIETLHFARFVLLDDVLVLSTTFDGKKTRHYRDLAELVPKGLDHVFRHCEGYWNYTGSVSRRLAKFLRDRDVGAQTHFIGTVGLTVRRIKEGERLRAAARLVLDGFTPAERAAAPEEVFARVAAALGPARPRAPAPGSTVSRVESGVRTAAYYAGAFGKLFAAAAIVPPVAVTFYPFLWQKEWTDAKAVEREAESLPLYARAARRRADDAQIARMDREDTKFVRRGSVQKALSHVVQIKPGLTRAVALRVAFAYVGYRAEYWDVEGDLAGIDSIHFARWVRLPGQRLLFLSDYDGSWESYLGDFVDEGAAGLSAVWSNTLGFPKTQALIADGARDERGFKRWVRTNQIETQVWYSAYPSLTVRRILDNEQLMLGFAATDAASEDSERWLALI